MIVRISWRAIGVGAGVAVVMLGAPASAQIVAGKSVAARPTTTQSNATAFSDRQAVEREIPWYERFSNSVVPGSYGDLPTLDERTRLTVAPSPRWGLSLDRGQQEGFTLRTSREEAAVSAYFQFTPRLRVGGRLSVTEQAPNRVVPAESNSSVRIESAFKF